ncbi:2116_t:CDS:2 [Cetraspora pellucida]|uniref:2116_t:CDS:1 n=1 Tax=Cetraspora pellucida TaxID=1433469 RepID=A0A9N9HJ21_9GLOM|nr:2116_t:CDS:2 [Cetraspora pellucida]
MEQQAETQQKWNARLIKTQHTSQSNTQQNIIELEKNMETAQVNDSEEINYKTTNRKFPSLTYISKEKMNAIQDTEAERKNFDVAATKRARDEWHYNR